MPTVKQYQKGGTMPPSFEKGGQKTDKEKQAYAFYISRGWTPEQALGIVGNLMRESGLNTTVVGRADDKGSQGVAQWHSGRLKALKDKYGSGWTDFQNQLEFVDWELKNTEKAAGDRLRNSKGVWQAGQAVSDYYERPKVKFVADEKRQGHVADLAMRLKGIKLTPEDMPNYGVTYENSVAPYMNAPQVQATPLPTIQVPQMQTQQVSYLQTTEETPKLAEETEQKQSKVNPQEQAFMQDLISQMAQGVTYVEPEKTAMFQKGGIAEFKKKPIVPQDERNLVQKDNTPNTKRDLSLMMAEYNNINKDKEELTTTGQIKTPRSIHYRQNVKVQPDIKTDTKSTEERASQLSPLERPLIYLASPEKLLGDVGAPGMETSEIDRQAIAANKFNPNQTSLQRIVNQAKLGIGYVPEAALNVGLTSALAPEGTSALGLVNETLNPLAGIKTSIPDELRQGLNSQGFLDIFKSKPSWEKNKIGENLVEMTPIDHISRGDELVKRVIDKNNEKEVIDLYKNYDGSYNFSASMKNKVNAGRAFKNIEETIPKGGIIKENESLSADSFSLLLNRAKKTDKFKNITNNDLSFIPLNDLAYHNKTINGIDMSGVYKTSDEAIKASSEIEKMINKSGVNIPKPEIFMKKVGNSRSYEVHVPNITLQKLYQQGGIIAGASYLATQEQPQYQQGGTIPPSFEKGGKVPDNEKTFLGDLKIKDSKIQGKGVFIDKGIDKGVVIGLSHTNEQPSTDLGRYHNHSETPNSENIKIGSDRFIVSLKPLKKGEEITVDYRKQPELEQPENFKQSTLTKAEENFLKDIYNTK